MNLLFFLLLLFFSLQPSGVPVNGVDIFNTGAFDCAPERKQITWTNDLGDIRIYNAQVWFGAYYGTRADIGVVIRRKRGGSVLFHENWDRYAEPNGMHVSELNLAPNYMTVKNGDIIVMDYWCQQFSEAPAKAHVILTIWYSK